MIRFLTVLALSTILCAACAKHVAESVVDAAVDVLLPSDVTACDAPAADTPADATLICADTTATD